MRANNILIRDVIKDPQDEQKIYLATDSGIYLSADDGKTWDAVNDGLEPTPFVYDLAFNPHEDNALYALTPFGIYKLEGK